MVVRPPGSRPSASAWIERRSVSLTLGRGKAGFSHSAVALPLLAKNEIGLPQCRRRPNAFGAECVWTQDTGTRVYLLNHAMVRLHASSAAALL
jgi:hypothetical protein